jgi:hypothetical protein
MIPMATRPRKDPAIRVPPCAHCGNADIAQFTLDVRGVVPLPAALAQGFLLRGGGRAAASARADLIYHKNARVCCGRCRRCRTLFELARAQDAKQEVPADGR